MSEYRAIYKCRLCGEEFETTPFCENDNSPFYVMASFVMGNDSFKWDTKNHLKLYTKLKNMTAKTVQWDWQPF